MYDIKLSTQSPFFPKKKERNHAQLSNKTVKGNYFKVLDTFGKESNM